SQVGRCRYLCPVRDEDDDLSRRLLWRICLLGCHYLCLVRDRDRDQAVLLGLTPEVPWAARGLLRKELPARIGLLNSPEGLDQFGHALRHAHARRIAKIAARSREVEPVIVRQFGGEKARHRRLALFPKQAPGEFAGGADALRGCEA